MSELDELKKCAVHFIMELTEEECAEVLSDINSAIPSAASPRAFESSQSPYA